MTKDNRVLYNEDIYSKIAMEDLILLGIYLVSCKKETCSFERLVAECFSRFPKIFAFKRYPEWPDSVKFDRPLRKLREKGFILGGVKDYFSLTKSGEKIAKQTKEDLEGKSILKQKIRTYRGRSADDRLVTYLKGASQFRDFLKNPYTFTISEPEFKNLLRCTLETSLRVVKQNLEYYKNLARSYKEKELLNFLLFCEKEFIKKG